VVAKKEMVEYMVENDGGKYENTVEKKISAVENV